MNQLITSEALLNQRLQQLKEKTKGHTTQGQKKPAVHSVIQEKFALRQPVALLLLDSSSSMEGKNIKRAFEGALAFSREALKKGYQVALVMFHSRALVLQTPTVEDSLLIQGLSKLEAMGTTNMAEAFDQALCLLTPYFQASTQRQVVALVTDGYADDESATLRSVARLKAYPVELMTLGTPDANGHFLAQIATRSSLAQVVPREKLSQGMVQMAKWLPSGDASVKKIR